jgi:acyl carrier protein
MIIKVTSNIVGTENDETRFDSNSNIFGENAPFDSLEFVNLIVGVEQNIEENYNHDQLIKQRRSNIELLYNELDSPYFSFVYDKPDSGVFPFAVPARVQSQYRNKILDKLFHDGILLSTLIEKWDFIPDRDKFIEESKFIDEHVLIPINEFISTNEMSVMVEKINNIKIL